MIQLSLDGSKFINQVLMSMKHGIQGGGGEWRWMGEGN